MLRIFRQQAAPLILAILALFTPIFLAKASSEMPFSLIGGLFSQATINIAHPAARNFPYRTEAVNSITALGVAFTENFDSMGNFATAAIPDGFSLNPTGEWSIDTTPNISTTQAYGTTGTGVVTGTSAGGAINWANGVTASATDRSLGFLNSTSYTSPRSIIVRITNNTGSTIGSLDIAFDYEKYRSGARQFDWTFFHGATTTPAIAAAAGNQSYAADANNNSVFNPPASIGKSFTLSGLSIPDGSHYYLRWTLTGLGGSTNGQGLGIDNLSITAFGVPTPPAVTTSAATGVTANSATLNGTANPNGDASTGWFRYSTVNPGTCNDTFGTRAPATGGTSLGSGSSPVSYSENVTGLAASTTYYYCAIASNTGGTGFGGVQSFTTPAVPEVQFEAAAIEEDEAQSVVVGVIRTGDTSGTSSVDVEIYTLPARPGAEKERGRSGGQPSGEGTPATPATAGADCSTPGVDIEFGGPVTLTFDPGETYMSVTMPLCSDLIDEDPEYIEFTLTNNVNTDVGTPSVVTVYINDTANQWFNFNSIGLPSSGDPPAEYPSEITASGAPVSIGSIRVTLFDVWVSDPTDLEVMLRGPNGVMYVLMADTGGTSPILSSDPVTLTFRDSATSIISPTTAPTTDVYLPTTCGTAGPFPAPAPPGTYNLPGCSVTRTVAEALFGSFGLSDGNGTWQLYVRGDNGAPIGPEGLSGEIAGWGLELLAPTNTVVSVSGRVTSPDGVGVRNAVVTMTDSFGTTWRVNTSSLGYFVFPEIPVGDTYVVNVTSRRYRFTPRLVPVIDPITDLDFVGQE